MLCHWGCRDRTFSSVLDAAFRVQVVPELSQTVATTLQSTQFNSVLGYYNGNRLWTDAVSDSPHRATANVEFFTRRFKNTVEDIYNLMSLKNVDTWKGLIYQTQVGQMGRSHLDLWDLYFGGSYDDAGVSSFFDVFGR